MLEFIAAFATIASLVGVVKPWINGWHRGHFAIALFGTSILFGVIGAVNASMGPGAEVASAASHNGKGESAARQVNEAVQGDETVRSKAAEALTLIPEYTRSEFPDTYKDVGAGTFAKMAKLQRGAIYSAAESNFCDAVIGSGPSDRSTRNAALFYVDCKNGSRFMVHQPSAIAASDEAEANELKTNNLKADCTKENLMNCLASDAQRAVDQATLASACDMAVQNALVGSSSMAWSWDFSYGNDDQVEIDRDFKAENAFGAKLKHRYLCTADAKTRKIVKLIVQGPSGTKRLV